MKQLRTGGLEMEGGREKDQRIYDVGRVATGSGVSILHNGETSHVDTPRPEEDELARMWRTRKEDR